MAEAVVDIGKSSQCHHTDAAKRKGVRISQRQNLKGQVVQVVISHQITFDANVLSSCEFSQKSPIENAKKLAVTLIAASSIAKQVISEHSGAVGSNF